MMFYLGDIRTGFTGFNRLSLLSSEVSGLSNKTLTIDCSSMRWFDAHMAAPLFSVLSQCGSMGNKIEFSNLDSKVKNILQRNGFLKPRIDDIHGTVISLEVFQKEEQKDFSKYVKLNLEAQDIPLMSDDLRSKFNEGVDEIFNNSVIHSKTKHGIFACGQHFPAKNKLDFVIVDAGIGIHVNVVEQLGLNLSSVEAIDWAMTDESTTRQGDIPGGLGLKIIREFVSLNKGRFIVVSNSGYWCLSGSGVEKKTLSSEFPGTAVIMEINTADENSYYLTNEVGPDDIF